MFDFVNGFSFVCLFICLFVCLFACYHMSVLYGCVFVNLSDCLLYACLFVVRLYVCVVCVFFCLAARLFVS